MTPAGVIRHSGPDRPPPSILASSVQRARRRSATLTPIATLEARQHAVFPLGWSCPATKVFPRASPRVTTRRLLLASDSPGIPGRTAKPPSRRLGTVLQPNRAVGARAVPGRASLRRQSLLSEDLFNTPFVGQTEVRAISASVPIRSTAFSPRRMERRWTGRDSVRFCFSASSSPTCGRNTRSSTTSESSAKLPRI